MPDQLDVGLLLEAVAERAVAFFREDLALEAVRERRGVEDAQEIRLRHLTSLLVLEGNSKLYIAFSFEKSLIEHAFQVYSDDIEVAEEEREGYVEETAGDMINIIVGNATARLPAGGGAVAISTPIVISEAKSIFRHKDARFYSASLETDYGKMDVYCIGPKELFGDVFPGLPSPGACCRRDC
jgi:CheY-specific phosphatase CheX